MPNEPSQLDAAATAKAAAKRRDDLLQGSPNPWTEIVKLEQGGDRSFAMVIQSIIFSSQPSGYGRIEDRLLAVFNNKDSTLAAKEFVCRMLAYIGSEKCLKTVVPLLNNAKTEHMARIALQSIAGEKVSAALRAALPNLTGVAKAGLIGTIGNRRDEGAVAALSAIKNDSSEAAVVREAAQRALTRIQSSHV